MASKVEREHHRKEICGQFRESGLTRKAFCEKHGIGLSTLGFWLRKERSTNQESNDGSMVVVGSVKASALHRALRIKIKQNIVIELDLPATEQEIRTVLRSVTEL